MESNGWVMWKMGTFNDPWQAYLIQHSSKPQQRKERDTMLHMLEEARLAGGFFVSGSNTRKPSPPILNMGH